MILIIYTGSFAVKLKINYKTSFREQMVTIEMFNKMSLLEQC